jgi:hypothetical protein
MTVGTGAQVKIGSDAPPEYSDWVTFVTNAHGNPSWETTNGLPAGAERSTEWSMDGTYSLFVPFDEPEPTENIFTATIGANF